MAILLKLALLILPTFANSSLSSNSSMDLKPNNLQLVEPTENSSAGQTKILILPVKTPHEIAIKSSESIYIKDRILKVRFNAGKTFLVGQKPGLTFIKIGMKQISVRILSPDDWQSHQKFMVIFSKHPSLKINYANFEPTIEGEILVESDFFELLNWLDENNSPLKFKLSFLNADFKTEALSILSQKLGFAVEDFDESMNLKLSKKADKDDLKKIDSLGLNSSMENSNGVSLGLLDIEFISLSDSDLKNASSILPTSVQWTLGEKLEFVSQIVNSDYSQLNSSNNRSSVINLMLFENEKTSYHSGGEFAIEQRSFYRNDVQWKTFGLFIEAMPVSFTKDEIHIDLKIRMSYLISSDMNQPSLSQDSWSQRFRLQRNKSLVVSNSLTNMFAKNRNNHLFLKSVPILGALFRGKNSNQEKSNVYMIVKLNSK